MIFAVVFVAGSVVVYVAAPVVGPRVVAHFRVESPLVEEASPSDSVEVQDAARSAAPVTVKTLDDEEVSPALEGVFLARASEQPGWGITSR